MAMAVRPFNERCIPILYPRAWGVGCPGPVNDYYTGMYMGSIFLTRGIESAAVGPADTQFVAVRP